MNQRHRPHHARTALAAAGLAAALALASLGAAPASASPPVAPAVFLDGAPASHSWAGSLPASTAGTGPAPASLPSAPLPAAKVAKNATVRTTANLRLRASASTSARTLSVMPQNTKLKVLAVDGAWAKLTFKGTTGWASTGYLEQAAAAKPTAKPAAKPAAKSALRKTTAALNLRQKATTSSKVLLTVPKGAILTVTATSGTWHRATFRGKTGWLSGSHLKVVQDRPGREVYIDGKYTSNRAGLTDRRWTKTAGADLFESVGGPRRIGDIPRNSVVYRDLAHEKEAGQVAGWYFVRTQGLAGWMKSSALQGKSTAPTASTKYTRAKVRSMPNGRLPADALVAIPWDREKTLVAAPALKDLTRLNTAFRKKFGRNLDIDLAYRTLDTQKYLYSELGPYIAAKPGTSNHGWGLAIDVPETRDYGFGGKYFVWLKANSKKYNWVHHKYLEQGSPYAEAWHFEYTGR